MIYTYDDMMERTKKFYSSLGLEKISVDMMPDAIASLIMPCYANEFRQHFGKKITDHRGIATLGDVACAFLRMKNKYHHGCKMDEMTHYKDPLMNINLNKSGEKLIDGLFSSNNDLSEANNKTRATAFEAIIGFLSLIDLEKANEIFKMYVSDE